MAKKIKFKPDTTIEAEKCNITAELNVTCDDELGDAYLYADNITAEYINVTGAAGIDTTSISTESINTNSISCSAIFDTDGITAKQANNATYATRLGSSTSYLTYSTLNTVKTKMDGIYNSTGVVNKAQTANTVNADGTNISIKVVTQTAYNSIAKDANTLYLIT